MTPTRRYRFVCDEFGRIPPEESASHRVAVRKWHDENGLGGGKPRIGTFPLRRIHFECDAEQFPAYGRRRGIGSSKAL